MIKERYSSYSKGVGKKIRDGKVSPPASALCVCCQCVSILKTKGINKDLHMPLVELLRESSP